MTRVLFIGNSYTYQNSLPEMLEAFAHTLVPETPLQTESVLAGGATLQSHHTQGLAPRRIREGGWSHVVLQEQSMLGGMRIDGVAYLGDPEALFFPGARLLAAQASAVGARTLFYMTWSRKTNLAAQSYLTYVYARIANELGAGLSPVGVAWERVRRERPELELYAEDGHHPGPAGSYLSACVLFASIFHRPCTGAPSTLTGAPWTGSGFDSSRTGTLVSLPEATARYLQQVGSEVALAERPLPDAPTYHPPLPSLPQGEPLQLARLAGEWSGSLAFYPSETGMTPAALQLSLEVRGAELAGSARLTFAHGSSAEASLTPLVQGEELSFSLPGPSFLESTVKFRAVLKSGALQGVAFAEDPQGGRWHGSWTVRR
ncbi:SGNH/GDSL hydrolase family protein [Hyalangium sp.]|uniref:SGNH/GDSL hydrolase family protein n=1 Tax=Hyalangium sp. TaxID=2028555 RepID=UPI002D2A68D1|nr:SGNH/GDSL hydrolase family protein [Hyalangium sp.]HYI00814.1 SGNH/GDSL hydrolase family protein [Hyalangium sp.]